MKALFSVSLVLALAFPALAADDKKDAKKKDDDKAEKKDDKKKDDKDKKAEKKAEKIVSAGTFTGRLMSVSPTSDKMLKVQIHFKYLTIDPQAQLNILRQQQDLLRRQQQIMLNPNPYQRQQQLAQLILQMRQQGQQNPYKVQEYRKDVELRAADDMKVRTLAPPVDYDDKGNVKKYTAKELKELKGNDNLPGYPADFDALREGQIVKVYLAPKKAAAKKLPKKAKAKKGKKKKDEDDDPEDDAEDLKSNKPEAMMIVVVAEPRDKGK